MLRSLYGFFFAILAIAAAVTGLIIFGHDYFKAFRNETLAGVIFIGAFAVVSFVYAMFLHVRWGRAVRYGLVLPYLNQGFTHIHDATRENPANSDHLLEACRNLCGNVATAFSVLTGSPCSVCIKVLAEEQFEERTRLRVVTMCRDNQSSDMRDYPQATPVKHWLDENSDFSRILQHISTPRGRFFISNRLPFYPGYRNTSFANYGGDPGGDIPGFRGLYRLWRWPLPYKSVVESPICPGISSKRSPDNLVGFLRVDSPRMFVFKEKFDTEILMGVADGIFTAVEKYLDSV
jgi:hypothetical protein